MSVCYFFPIPYSHDLWLAVSDIMTVSSEGKTAISLCYDSASVELRNMLKSCLHFSTSHTEAAHTKTQERTICAPQNGNLSSLYIQFLGALQYPMLCTCAEIVITCIDHCSICVMQISCCLDASFMVLHFGWPAVYIKERLGTHEKITNYIIFSQNTSYSNVI